MKKAVLLAALGVALLAATATAGVKALSADSSTAFFMSLP